MTLPSPVSDALDALHNLIGDTNSSTEAVVIAQKTLDYADSLAKGEISSDECADLIADLKVDAMIAQSADALAEKVTLQRVIANLVAVLSLIPIP